MKFFSILLLFVMSCSHEAILPTYKDFKLTRDLILENGIDFRNHSIDHYYQKIDYTDDEYIYVYVGTNSRIDSRCVWGWVVDKSNNEYQKAKSWVILKGKDFCINAHEFRI